MAHNKEADGAQKIDGEEADLLEIVEVAHFARSKWSNRGRGLFFLGRFSRMPISVRRLRDSQASKRFGLLAFKQPSNGIENRVGCLEIPANSGHHTKDA